jgi:hypothetical protein
MQLISASAPVKDSLGPVYTLLLSDRIALKSPQVPHFVEIKLFDQLRYVLPIHPVALGMEIKILVDDIRASQLLD